MSLDQSSSALHLSLPPASSSTARTPSVINVHPSVLASILTHHSRRPAAEEGASASSSSGSNNNNNTRVMGALMGHRSESGAEVEIRSCFAVPHSENEQQIALDMPFQQAMVKLLSQNGTKEVVVGWYATSAELNPYSALIQNYFSAETAPFPAVHLTVDTALTASGQGLGVKGYVSTTLGLTPKAENCAFLPVEVALKFGDSERAALDLLTAPAPTPSPALPPLPALSASLDQLSSLIDQSLAYVSSQTAAGATPSAKDIEVGRYLLEGVGRWNAVGTEDEGGVREGVQDTLTVTYLANLVRSQMELGGRLTLLQQAQ